MGVLTEQEFYGDPWDLTREWTWRDTAARLFFGVVCTVAAWILDLGYWLVVVPYRWLRSAIR